MKTTRILAISGSLRATSSNTSVLTAAALLAPAEVEIILYKGLGDLPHFNADLELSGSASLPPQVQELRRHVDMSDGLMICSPEYAHGVAGSLKNALDWLVGGAEFFEKPVALINAAPRAVHADAQLREILTTMSARLVDEACVALPVSGVGRDLDTRGIASDPALSLEIRKLLTLFVNAVRQ